MVTTYDEAVAALYQAPLASFVTERKELASELKASGDKQAAQRLNKLPRPPPSAWVVNQLWWQTQDAFQALFAAADRLRHGDRAGAEAHRAALATLRSQAASALANAGHPASEAVLRRVMTNLASLAATGSFAPDLPGALSSDRAPPGFDSMPLPAPSSAPNRGELTGETFEPAEEIPLIASGHETEPLGIKGAEKERRETQLRDDPALDVPAHRAERAQAVRQQAASAEDQRRERERAAALGAEAARAEAASAEAARAEAAQREAARRGAERAARAQQRQRLEAELAEATKRRDTAARHLERLRAELSEAERKLENEELQVKELARGLTGFEGA